MEKDEEKPETLEAAAERNGIDGEREPVRHWADGRNASTIRRLDRSGLVLDNQGE